eukprot:GHVQ01011031.1.p1 GENE.GHVQ01011031.1~~GHVQ01011031.1.p1  ORF type:complete len:1479 (-),score=141.02 GHVQ01011031.1:965-5212(-)
MVPSWIIPRTSLDVVAHHSTVGSVGHRILSSHYPIIPPRPSSISITSHTGPVTIHSHVSLHISLRSSDAASALFRSSGELNVEDDVYKPDFMVARIKPPKEAGLWEYIKRSYGVTVTFDGDDHAPLYATVVDTDEDISEARLHAWAGQQQQDRPHLLDVGKDRLEAMEKWVAKDPSAPWIAQMGLLGTATSSVGGMDRKFGGTTEFMDLGTGVWRLLSSSAYLGGANSFVAMSGGMLRPRKRTALVHITGLFCRESEGFTEDEEPQLVSYDLDAERRHKGIQNSPANSSTSTIEPTPHGSSVLQMLRSHRSDKPASATQAPSSQSTGAFDLRALSSSSQIEFESSSHSPSSSRRRLQSIKSTTGTRAAPVPYPGSPLGILKPPKTCTGDLLQATFLTLWKALNNTRAASTLFVWTSYAEASVGGVIEASRASYQQPSTLSVPSSAKLLSIPPSELSFGYDNEAITMNMISWTDIWYFIVATWINYVSALVIAVVVSWVLLSYLLPSIHAADRYQKVLKAASHRLDHQICRQIDSGRDGGGTASGCTEDEEWNLVACSVLYPRHGILLRWSPREKAPAFSRIVVQIQTVFSPQETKQPYERQSLGDARCGNIRNPDIYLYMSPAVVTQSHQLGRNQRELFVPARNPGIIEAEITQHYTLAPHEKYRFRVVTLSGPGRAVDQSSWSAETALGYSFSVADLPLCLLSNFLPPQVSCLSIFFRKLTKPEVPFCMPIRMRDLHLQFFDIPGGLAMAEHCLLRDEFERQGSMRRRYSRAGIGGHRRQNTLRGSTRSHATVTTQAGGISHYIVVAYFGAKASQARETYTNTGRQCYSEVNFSGRPVIQSPDNQAASQAEQYGEVRGGATDVIRLEKDRISQNIVRFEVSAGRSGQAIAVGSIHVDDLYPMVEAGMSLQSANLSRRTTATVLPDSEESPRTLLSRLLSLFRNFCVWLVSNFAESAASSYSIIRPSSGEDEQYESVELSRIPTPTGQGSNNFEVRLWHIEGGAPWGRLVCSLDMEKISYYVRHTRLTDLGRGEMSSGRRQGTHSNFVDTLRAEAEATEVAELARRELSWFARDTRDYSRIAKVKRLNPQRRTHAAHMDSAGGPKSQMMQYLTHKTKPLLEHGTEIVSKPYFIRDAPGRPLLLGGDLFVQWVWEDNEPEKRPWMSSTTTVSTKPDDVILYLFDHATNKPLAPIHWGRPIPNTGTYMWQVEAPFKEGQTSQLVFIGLFAKPTPRGSGSDDEGSDDANTNATKEATTTTDSIIFNADHAICQTNGFFIVRPLPLAELEFAYGAFCRSHQLEMHHMSESALSQHGYQVQEMNIKICPNLRPIAPFEPSADAIHCPGTCCLLVTHVTSVLITPRSHNPRSHCHSCVLIDRSMHRKHAIEAGATRKAARLLGSSRRRIREASRCVQVHIS